MKDAARLLLNCSLGLFSNPFTIGRHCLKSPAKIVGIPPKRTFLCPTIVETVVFTSSKISLFRKILDFSRAEYMKEKESYHVSADINMVKAESEYSDSELLELFSQNDARQVLHVTFGKVLTEKDNTGEYLFRNEFLKCIKENEELHYKFIYEHFRKHLSPFEVNSKN